MNYLKPHWVFLFFFIIAPVTTSWREWRPVSTHERGPADAGTSNDCRTLAKDLFLSKNYVANQEAALTSRKLLSFTNKFVTVNHPKLEWMNKMRASLNKSIRNWNNNRYPSFYLFNEEEVLPAAKNYFENVLKILDDQSSLTKVDLENLKMVQAWVKSYKDYNADVTNLLDERISLQYNLTLLKKLKLKDESRDIKLMIKRDGKMTEEIFTLRKEDKNLDPLIKQLENEIEELDGTVIKNGKIKDRIVRQAMLQDILTIVQRELEHKVKNGQNLPERMTKELEKLESLIDNPALSPSTYGVYRITNKQFTSEVLRATKLDGAVQKIKTAINENGKLGIVRSLFNKVSNITPKQAAYGFSGSVVVAIGSYQYFSFGKESTVEIIRGSTEVLEEKDQEVLDKTIEEEKKKSDDHSSVVEITEDELKELDKEASSSN